MDRALYEHECLNNMTTMQKEHNANLYNDYQLPLIDIQTFQYI